MAILTIEAVRDGVVHGWVYDPARLKRRVTVQLLLGGVPILERRADIYREDLKDAGIGDGRHGFALQAPLDVLQSEEVLSVDVADGAAIGGPVANTLNDQIKATLRTLLWKSITAEVSVSKTGIAADLAILVPKGFSGQLRASLDDVLIWTAPANSVQADAGFLEIFIPGDLRTGEAQKFELILEAYGNTHLLVEENLVFQSYTEAIAGWVDGVFEGILRGWAWDTGDPSKTMSASVFVDDRFVGRTVADMHRSDLETRGVRGGIAGFEYRLPAQFWDARPHIARVEIHGLTPTALPIHAFTLIKDSGLDPRIYLDQAQLPEPIYKIAGTETGISSSLVQVGTQVASFTDASYLRRTQRHRQPIDIIIPIFNAPDHLRRCLAAVRRNTTVPYRLNLVDDASDADGMDDIFAMAEAIGARVLKNPENLGFTGSVNLAIEQTVGDVVLLNSDTEVGPRWLERLAWTAYSNPSVGTVSAVSQNAGAFSVPTIYEQNDLIPGLSADDNAVLFGRSLSGGRMAVPTGHGFCMYIRRSLLNDIGSLDRSSFPRGYGEENDFCMRAMQAGYQNIVQPRVVVGHAKGASFQEEREHLMSAGQEALRRLHPQYLGLTGVLRGPSLLADARTAAQDVVQWASKERNAQAALSASKPRVLIALHYAGEGGTALTTEDLVAGLQRDFNCFLLTTEGAAVVLSEWQSGWKEVARWSLRAKIDYLDAPRPDYEVIVTNLLVDFDISLLHVRHLIGHHAALMHAASDLHIPIIWSLHDFYQICPSVSLVDAEGRYCAGRCTPGEVDCKAVVKLPSEYGRLRNGYIENWQSNTAKLAAYADAIVTTSPSIRDTMVGRVPALAADSKFHVIEHGRDRDSNGEAARRPRVGEPIRVLMLGNLLPTYKGFSVAQAVKKLDIGGDVEFHFLGAAPVEARQVGIVHGRYSRADLVERIGEINPSVVGIWSTWPETYCHTLSEAWLAGVPVIGSVLGAVGERLAKHGGGWVMDCEKPDELIALLRHLKDNPAEWDAQLDKASARNLRSAREMASDYRILYKRLIRAAGFGKDTAPIVQALIHRTEPDLAWGTMQARCASIFEHSAVRAVSDVLLTSSAEVAVFGSPSLSVPARRVIIDDAGDIQPSQISSGQIVCLDNAPPFINELPWRAAAFLPDELVPLAGSTKVVAIVAERKKIQESDLQLALKSLSDEEWIVRIVSPSQLPPCDGPLEYAAMLRQALLGASLVLPISTCDHWISDELSLVELALLGIPLLWDPKDALSLGLPPLMANTASPVDWPSSVRAALSDTSLIDNCSAQVAWLVERWGATPRTPDLIAALLKLSGQSE